MKEDRPFKEIYPIKCYANPLNTWNKIAAEFDQEVAGKRFLNTPNAEEFLSLIADPDFMGYWIQILNPKEGLELLIESVTNIELLCQPNSPYYTFETYNERLSVQKRDVKDLVEKMYGTMYMWDIGGAKDVSRRIEQYLKSVPVYGSTVGEISTENGNVSFKDNMFDGDALQSKSTTVTNPNDTSDANIGVSDTLNENSNNVGSTMNDYLPSGYQSSGYKRSRNGYGTSRKVNWMDGYDPNYYNSNSGFDPYY